MTKAPPMKSEATPGREELLAANMQASIQVGPLQCSQGGHPYNGDHIEYWKSRAIKAERRIAEDTRLASNAREATIEECASVKIEADIETEAQATCAFQEGYVVGFQDAHFRFCKAIRGLSNEGCAEGAKPADEKMREALKDARFYVEDAYKRSHHAYDKAALEQIDDALSTTGEPKR